MPSQRLLEAIDALPATRFDGEAFRHVSAGRDPLSTAGSRAHGGRWNPPDVFGALYLALDEETAVAELERAAAAQALPVAAMLPRTIHRVRIVAPNILDLRASEALAAVNLDAQILQARSQEPCRAVGQAAHYLERQGVLAPSATGRGTVLALFPDRMPTDSVLEPVAQWSWRPD